MDQHVIEISNLHKQYGDFRAVNGLSLNVTSGDVYGFLGPNGAGKSTTIRMMLSLIRPTSGSIKIFGLDLANHRTQILSRIGAIVERPDFYNYLTAQKNLELLGRLSGADVSSASISRILGIVGLESRAQSKVKTFSHGMKQRLGIAQALLHSPDLIVLDEPTTGLDPQGMVDIRDLILELATDHKKTIFISSHILPEVELTATRMVIINRGKAIVEGAVKDLLNAGRLKVTVETPLVQQALAVVNGTSLGQYVQSSTNSAFVIMLERDEIADLVTHLSNNQIPLLGVSPVRSLEEYFISLTQGAS